MPPAADFEEVDRPHEGPPWRRPWREPGFSVADFYGSIAATLDTITAEDEVTRRSKFTSESVADYKRAIRVPSKR